MGFFFYLSKGFDTINHSLQKCEYYGIRGMVNNWLQI